MGDARRSSRVRLALRAAGHRRHGGACDRGAAAPQALVYGTWGPAGFGARVLRGRASGSTARIGSSVATGNRAHEPVVRAEVRGFLGLLRAVRVCAQGSVARRTARRRLLAMT